METMQRVKIYFLFGTSVLLIAMALLVTSGCVVMSSKQLKKIETDNLNQGRNEVLKQHETSRDVAQKQIEDSINEGRDLERDEAYESMQKGIAEIIEKAREEGRKEAEAEYTKAMIDERGRHERMIQSIIDEYTMIYE